jgi:hypothetical protein
MVVTSMMTCILNPAFDVTNPRFDHALLFASGMVFGVFFQVTQLAGRTDVLAELWTNDLGQVSVNSSSRAFERPGRSLDI